MGNTPAQQPTLLEYFDKMLLILFIGGCSALYILMASHNGMHHNITWTDQQISTPYFTQSVITLVVLPYLQMVMTAYV